MTVDGSITGSIGVGLLVLVGVTLDDTGSDADRAAEKIAGLRVFPDEAGLMNRSVIDVGGSVLVVSQFTLLADATKGRRPSFTAAADPDHARALIDRLVETLRAMGVVIETGVFGASMSVELVNEGPVTIVLDIRDGRVV